MKKVIILHLETATKACSVCLSVDGKLVALKELTNDGYSHGENLTLFINDVLAEAEVALQDVSAIAVASGPGSYTGLRIGVSTAKGLCYALCIPLIAIDSLSSLAEIAKGKYPNSNLCALIDARRMEVYNLLFDSFGKALKDISADIIDESSYTDFEPFVYFGDGSQKLEDIWKDKNCIGDFTIESSAIGQLQLAYQKYLVQNFEDLAYFEPFYLKDFVAGVKVKK
jgi:tRNA threonylcarbamoyladenosine biosynthesis protein TsaB